MSGYSPSADVLVPLFDPSTPFDVRKAATLKFASEAWARGWDDCLESLTRYVEGLPEVTREAVLAKLRAER